MQDMAETLILNIIWGEQAPRLPQGWGSPLREPSKSLAMLPTTGVL